MPRPSHDSGQVLAHLHREWADLFTDPLHVSAERLNEFLRQFLADIDARRADALRITADGRGPGRKVAVRVNADGVIIQARVADDAGTSLTANELAQEIVAAAQSATTDVRTKVAAQLDPIEDFITEMSASMADEEWKEIIHAARATTNSQRTKLQFPPTTQASVPSERDTGNVWDTYR